MIAIIWNEDESTGVYWTFEVNRKEYEQLSHEISHYNEWIARLKKGDVPPESYVDRESRDLLTNPRRDNHHESFDMKRVITSETEEPDEDTEITESQLQDLQEGDYNELISLIENPYNSYDYFAIGSKMLPITARLIARSKRNVIEKYISGKIS